MPDLVTTYQAEAANSPTTLQTAYFRPRQNEILVAKVTAGDEATVLGAPSGGGLTWTDRGSTSTANYTPERIFTATVGENPPAMAVTVSTTGAQTGSYPTLSVERWANAAVAAGPAVVVARSSVNGAPSATINPANAAGVITWVSNDWNGVTGGTVAYRSGATELYQRRVNAAVNVFSAWQPSVTTTPQTIGLTGPTGQKWSIVGLELIPGPAPVTETAVLTDRTNQSFTATNGQTSTYHIYASGINTGQPVGLMMWFHGDGAFEYDNPTDPYCLAGPRGVIAEAKRRNCVLIVAKAPDTTGAVTWWENGAANAVFARDLILARGYGDYDIAKVWLNGYSGGAQFVTQFLLPAYPSVFERGGGAVVFGGGGSPLVTAQPFSAQLKAGFHLHFYTGAEDLAANDPVENYDGLLEAQAGAAYYAGQGFPVTSKYPTGTDHNQVANQFGAVCADVMSRYEYEPAAFAGSSTTVAQTFESVTGMTSGTWTRVTTAAHAGTGSLRSPTVANNGSADAVFAVPAGALTVRFWYQTSTELDGDFLRVVIGADNQQVQSGPSPYGWQESPPYDVRGASSVTFRYQRDASGGAGTNQVWIDDLAFETVGPVTVSGAVALSGGDTLTVGARQTFGAAAALSGADTLAVSAGRSLPGAAALSGADTLVVATQAPQRFAAVALSATDELRATTGPTAVVALSGVDSLVVPGVLQGYAAVVALGGADTLSVRSPAVPYRLLPVPPAGGTSVRLDGPYTLGTEFEVTRPVLATTASFYRWDDTIGGGQVGGLFEVTGPSSGTELARTGTFPASTALGWQDAPLLTAVWLSPGTRYKVAIVYPTGFTQTGDYWVSGPGGDGVTSGPLHAFSRATATNGQSTYASGAALTYPDGVTGQENWWAGLTVLDLGVVQDQRVAAALTGANTLVVGAARVQFIAAALVGTDTITVPGTIVKIGAVALAGTDTLSTTGLRTAVVAAALRGTDTLIARAVVTGGGMLNPSLWAVDRATGRLRPLPHPVKLQVTDVANDVGSISVDYPVYGRGFDLLEQYVSDDSDLEVEVWLEGRRATRMVGYLDQRSGDDVTEGAVWQFTGTLITSRLDEARVDPQPITGVPSLGSDVEVARTSVTSAQWSRLYALGYRTTESEPDTVRVPQLVLNAVKANSVDIPQLSDPKREVKFSAATPGSIMLFLLGQAWSRGALTDITVDFTATRDSAGNTWPEVLTAKWSPGVTLLQVAQRLVELGLADFIVTPDRVLRVWRFGGRGADLSIGVGATTLRRGQNLLQAGRRQGARGAGTDFLVIGGDGGYQTAADLNARARRGRLVETSTSVGNITEPSALAAAAQRTAAAGVRGQDERTFALALGVGMPRPGPRLGVGDTVRIDTTGTLGTGRLAQWDVVYDVNGPAAQVTTGDLIRSRAAALAKRLSDQQSGDTVIGTSQPSEDRGVPSAPTGLVVASAAFLEGQDVYAAVTAGWAPVQTNTDGSAATDLASYRVEYRLESNATAWNLGAEVDAQRTTASWTVGPNTPIRVRVQAVDRSGNRSAWSPEVVHITEDDATPPPVPSAPVVSDFIGTLRITWDGLSAAGGDMPVVAPDFSYVEVHLSTASNFTPDASTAVTRIYARGTWTIADLPIGVTQFARLVAVDLRGNASAPSVQGSDTPRQLLGPEIFDGAVGSAKLADLAVIRAKVADLMANNAKIADASIGKITAGILSADVLLSGIIRTATTGSRTEIDNAGIRLYDPSGAIRVNLATVTGNALVTGEYRTALSGSHIRMNPLGSAPAETRWYPADGVRYSRMKPATSVAAGFEGQGGIIMKAYSGRTDQLSGEAAVFPDYASVAFGSEMDGGGGIVSRIAATSGNCFVGGPKVDISYGAGQWCLVGRAIDNAYIPNTVLRLGPRAGDGNGAIGVVDRHSYIQFDSGSVSVVNDGTFIDINVDQVIFASERQYKDDVEADPFDPAAVVRAADWYRYTKPGKQVPGGPECGPQLGLMLDELPDEVVRWNPDMDRGGVSGYGLTAILWGLGRQHIAQIERLEREVADLRRQLGPARPLAVA